jgi:hypothetical protein
VHIFIFQDSELKRARVGEENTDHIVVDQKDLAVSRVQCRNDVVRRNTKTFSETTTHLAALKVKRDWLTCKSRDFRFHAKFMTAKFMRNT